MPAQSSDDWRPTASLPILALRACLLREIRRFFDEADYLEVETPILSRDIVVDAHIEPFSLPATPPLRQEYFLQTSPEFHMKRLLAAGATAIYQICRVMRSGEIGPRHNPEFTMIEWYRVGDTYHDQMTVTENLVRRVFERGAEWRSLNAFRTSTRNEESCAAKGGTTSQKPIELSKEAFERMTYDDAFERYAGTRVLGLPTSALVELTHDRGIVPPPGLRSDDRDGWLSLLLALLVEPRLGVPQPVFLYDYPASQSALARVREEPGHPAVAERFELYFEGVELCNGYHELTDAEELRRRIVRQNEIRTSDGLRTLPEKSRLLDAMDSCLPACAGVALGLDRLIMVIADAESVTEVTSFAFERA